MATNISHYVAGSNEEPADVATAVDTALAAFGATAVIIGVYVAKDGRIVYVMQKT